LASLGVLNKDIEVSIVIEDIRIQQFEFRRILTATPILFD
jgi:hypothetical protein